jgi:hypothetical protein
MEEKDVKDMFAVLLDHRVGEGENEISPSKMRKILEKEKKLLLTVTLTLRNLVGRTSDLNGWLGESEVSTVHDRICELLDCLPRADKK